MKEEIKNLIKELEVFLATEGLIERIDAFIKSENTWECPDGFIFKDENGNVVPKGSAKHREMYPEDF